MSNSKLKLTCHKLSPMAAHWWQGQSFFFLLAELPFLSLASVNRCENRIAFTLDILIPRCAFLMFPSLCVLRLFHRICIPQALHAVAQFPTILQRLWTRCLCIACLSDIDTCFLYLTPAIWFSALFSTSYFGRSRHTYFFRRKVSASRIVSSTSALLPELFQKLFRLTSSKKLFYAKVK